MADTSAFTTAELEQIRDLYPPEWLDEGAAVGSPEHVAERARRQLAAGADRVILHGNAPADLAAVADAFSR